MLQGGTRSGKTRSCIDYLISHCYKYNGIEIDICRDTFTSLKTTVYAEFQKVLRGYKLDFDIHKSDHIITINGCKIHFYGLDNDEKIHGKERDIIWINEINQIKESVYDQIAPRTRHRIIGDLNPRLGRKHWLDPYLKKYTPIVTTYLHNPFLTKSQVEDIESKKDNKYWWSIYGMGERAIIEGAIFDNWEVGDFDDSLPYAYGQDFGYSKDPTTLIKVAVCNRTKTIYAKECFYNYDQIKTHQLYEANKAHINNTYDLIVADSQEGRLIDEIEGLGLNIIRAHKPPGSVFYGITRMLGYKIVISPDSDNLIDEFSNYIWSDKKAGVPIDKYNHGIDAIRYVFDKLIGDEETNVMVGFENLY